MTGAADAALQTWTVGQNFGYNNAAGTNRADPPQWRGAQTFGASALNGVASVFGPSYTVHSWYQAANNHTTSNDIGWTTFGATPQGALAIGIRFDAGAGNDHYGWAEMSNDANDAYSVER